MILEPDSTSYFEITEVSSYENSINDTKIEIPSQDCNMETNSYDQQGQLETISFDQQLNYDNTMVESIIKVEPYELAENPLMNEEQMDKKKNVVKAGEQDEDGDSSCSDHSKSSETFPCPLCPKYSHRLDNHINKFHSSPLNINRTICGLCIQKFKSTKPLRAHQSDCHNGHAFACDICKLTFTKYSTMKSHIFKNHSKLKLHSCHLCDNKYFTAFSLQTHINSGHTREHPFQCEVKSCRKFFWKESYFTEHKNVHIRPLFTCKMCAKTFVLKRYFSSHMRKIHGLRDSRILNLLSHRVKSNATRNLNPDSNSIDNTMEQTIKVESTIKVEPTFNMEPCELAEDPLMIEKQMDFDKCYNVVNADEQYSETNI